MKNAKPILIAVVSLVLGYMLYPLLHNDTDDTPASPLEPDPNAQEEVTNYTGFNKYYVITDETLDWLAQVRETDDLGSGVVVYYGTTEGSSGEANLLIAARVKAEGTTPSVTGQYYAMTTMPPMRPACPDICDVLRNGLDIVEVDCPQRPAAPVDSVEVLTDL